MPNQVVVHALERFGPRVDVLANVAGVMDNFGSLDSLTDASLQRCLAVNLTAPIRLSRTVIANMREHRGGSIVNVASKAGLSGAAAGIAYTASAWRTAIWLRACVVNLTSDMNRQARARRSHQASSMAIQKRGHPLQRRSTWRYVR
jgi:NAD(P)-dependent dehydrogenase (short-subunit alcohol dehydrogenase family)